MKIEITYCYDCGYTDMTLSLVEKILSEHEDDIEALTLIPASDGIFDVAVDGKLIFSKHQTNRFPNFKEITAALSG